jgi:hypothetical protein
VNGFFSRSGATRRRRRHPSLVHPPIPRTRLEDEEDEREPYGEEDDEEEDEEYGPRPSVPIPGLDHVRGTPAQVDTLPSVPSHDDVSHPPLRHLHFSAAWSARVVIVCYIRLALALPRPHNQSANCFTKVGEQPACIVCETDSRNLFASATASILPKEGPADWRWYPE